SRASREALDVVGGSRGIRCAKGRMDGSRSTRDQRSDGAIGFLGTLAWFRRIAITGSCCWHHLYLRTQSIENLRPAKRCKIRYRPPAKERLGSNWPRVWIYHSRAPGTRNRG